MTDMRKNNNAMSVDKRGVQQYRKLGNFSENIIRVSFVQGV